MLEVMQALVARTGMRRRDKVARNSLTRDAWIPMSPDAGKIINVSQLSSM